MFNLYFLEAKEPIRKKFWYDELGDLQQDNYPQLKKFKSHTETVITLDEMFAALQHHADKGHCLSKGILHEELDWESRAGKTNTEDKTRFMVLDFDGVQDLNQPEDIIPHLPREYHNVSYIWQESASAGIKGRNSLNGHLYFILEETVAAMQLKLYLQHLNLSIPFLRRQTKLTASGVALRYPLDITPAQNDKLIYLSDPECANFDPPEIQRWRIIKKDLERLTVYPQTVMPNVIFNQVQERVSEIRENLGLPKKKANLKKGLLQNPDVSSVQAVKKERGFVYLHLAGEDSPTAYYYPESNPRVLSNFLGEPPCLLEDILPDYAAQVFEDFFENNRSVLAIRDIQRDKYYNGFVHDTHVDLYETRGKDRLMDFLKNNDMPQPDSIPDWHLLFRPDENWMINFEERKVNLFNKSDYIRRAEQLPPLTELPPKIKEVLYSALGDDQETVERFINWLAYIVQKRTKAQTAWIAHGTYGTGKGTLFQVISRIIGDDYCRSCPADNLGDKFNAWAEKCLFLMIDEAENNDRIQANKINNMLRHWITEPTLEMRDMRTLQYSAPSYINVMFASNRVDIVEIPEGDRRYNVGFRQERPLRYTRKDIDAVMNETLDFTRYLIHYEVDEHKANTTLENAAKKQLQLLNQNTYEQFFSAVRKGDLEFFAEALNDDPDPMSADEFLFQRFKRVIEQWIQDEQNDATSIVPVTDLFDTYRYLLSSKDMKRKRFSRMCGLNGLDIKTRRIDNVKTQVIEVTWHSHSADSEPTKAAPTHSSFSKSMAT